MKEFFFLLHVFRCETTCSTEEETAGKYESEVKSIIQCFTLMQLWFADAEMVNSPTVRREGRNDVS